MISDVFLALKNQYGDADILYEMAADVEAAVHDKLRSETAEIKERVVATVINALQIESLTRQIIELQDELRPREDSIKDNEPETEVHSTIPSE